MKEKIYTIPVNDSFSKNCECPLCDLESKLEKEAVDYSLGAAMMEPDFRILSNDLGFCNKHYSLLINKKNKLGLALVLDTHLEELRNKFAALNKDIISYENEKPSLFKKSNENFPDLITRVLDDAQNSCIICDKISKTLERYIDVIFYLWAHDEEFRKKVTNGKGFCMRHFNILCKEAFSNLNKKTALEFVKTIYEKQIKELERIQTDIHKFTLKFDYRNKDLDLGEAHNAPIRTIEKISGYISDNSPE